MSSLLGLTIWTSDYGNSTVDHVEAANHSTPFHPDKMVAYFSIIHVGIWIIVGIFDRYIKKYSTSSGFH